MIGRVLAMLLVAALVRPGAACADDIGQALRESRWADADALAVPIADPVARKLVLYYRLLAPGAAHPGEIAAFLADSPDWPNGALLARRLAEAQAAEPDDRGVQAVCARKPVAALHCAEVPRPDPVEAARQAWVAGVSDPAAEVAFARQWGRALTPGDQWRRFDRLAWADSGAVNGPAWRQLARLDAAQRPAGEARLALKRDDASARALVAALPGGAAVDPALMLELARWLRRANADEAAVALWLGLGAAAEAAAPAERRAAFWDERNLLARRRLRAGDAAGAYALVAGVTGAGPEQAMDAAFLAGYIALRRTGDLAAAARHFQALAGLSRAAITQARAAYWLGRTADARHDLAGARRAYAAAADWPTTFYGQLAARALGEDDAALAARIRAARDPASSPSRGEEFLATEDARAAVLLASWGEVGRARSFVLRLDALAADGAGRLLAARFALGLGQPDLAVTIARRAGRDGLVMMEAGWPLAVSPPEGVVEPALALALIRQESNFNAEAQSPAGARGLMQLMPATAQAVARRLDGGAANLAALTSDPAYNMRLGTAYLGGLLEQFGGAVPFAVAGYNAGPGRVGEWLAVNGQPGQPGQGGLDMVDWIELIPFGETRNYVQRVVENVVVYRALAGAAGAHPLARWLE